MTLRLGDTFPNFSAETSVGPMHFHDWIGNDGSWAILFSHPADFTPVCTTELARVANLAAEFARRHVKLVALACDSAKTHQAWIEDIRAYAKVASTQRGGGDVPVEFPFPIVDDQKRELATQLGMLDPVEKDAGGLPLTCRAVFIVGPDKRLKASILYPATTGRNFDEILRVVDSLQLTMKHPVVATPVDWKPGEKCMILPSVKAEELPKLFPRGYETVALPSGKGYMKVTEQPSG